MAVEVFGREGVGPSLFNSPGGRVLLLWVLGTEPLLACVDKVGVNPPLPSSPHQALLLVVSREDEVLQVFASPPELADPGPELSLPVGGDNSLHALYYDCPLDALGLSPGWQALDRSGGAGLPLPRPSEALTASLVGAGLSDWRPAGELPASLRRARFPAALRLDNCARITGTLTPLKRSLGQAAILGIPLGPSEALVGTSSGSLYRVTPHGAELLHELSKDHPSAAGVRDSSGQIWLFGIAGEIYRGTVDAGFVRTATLAAPVPRGVRVDVAGSRAPAPVELFVVTKLGTVDRFWEDRWTRVWPGDPVPMSGDPRVIWLGQGRALATGFTSSSVFHFPPVLDERGKPRLQRLVPMITGAHVTALTYVEGIGILVAANTQGQLFVASGHDFGSYDDGEGWQLFDTGPSPGQIQALLPFREGFLMALESGRFVEYDPRGGFCPAQGVTDVLVQGLIPLDDAVLVLTAGSPERDAAVVWAQPQLPDQGCSGQHW